MPRNYWMFLLPVQLHLNTKLCCPIGAVVVIRFIASSVVLMSTKWRVSSGEPEHLLCTDSASASNQQRMGVFKESSQSAASF